jgi:hypothetical protein
LTARRGTDNAKFIIPAAIGLWLVSILVFSDRVPGWVEVAAGLAMILFIAWLVAFLILRQSGWHDLARAYPARPPLAGTWQTCRTAVMAGVSLDSPEYERRKVRFNFIVRVGCDDQALYVSALPILRPLLPPMRIPWSAMANARYFDASGWVNAPRDPGALLQLTYDPGYKGQFVEIEVTQPKIFLQLPAHLLAEALPHLPMVSTDGETE